MSAPLAEAPVRTDFPQFQATVVGVRDLGGGMRRVTLEAPELGAFSLVAPDEYVGLVMPRAGQPLVMPEPGSLDVRAAVAEIPEPSRPGLRWYTLRHHDAGAGRVDIDIVTHGDSGPGSAWTCRAAPGYVVGVRAAGGIYRGLGLVGRQVLVADESAVPSVAAILDAWGGAEAAAAQGVEVYVEVPDQALLSAYDLGGAHVSVRAGAPGSAVVGALAASLARDGVTVDYAWICGEAKLAAGAKRALRRQGVPKDRLFACGYWKLGSPRP